MNRTPLSCLTASRYSRAGTGLRLFTLAVAALFWSLSAHGQARPVTPQDDLNPDDVIGTLVMVDESTPAVLDLLERLTGMIILRPQNLQPQRVNFDSRGPITRQQAVRALESILSMNGLAIVQVDGFFLRAVQSGVPVNPFTPEIITADRLDAPPSQKVFSKIYTLSFLTVDQALEILPSFLTPNVPAPVPFRKTNSLLITDALSNLQRLEKVFKDLDRPKSFDDQILFFSLNHINARDLHQTLHQMVEGSLNPYLGGNTTFAVDERSNQLIIFTHPSNERLVKSLVRQFDVDVAPLTRSEVFYIKHADAVKIAGLIDQVISRQRTVRQQDTRGTRRPTRNGETPAPLPDDPNGPQDVNAGGNGNGSITTRNLQFSEYVAIVPDERSNALVAYGTNSDIRYVGKLIEDIDILLAQVRIEVIIAEVTLSDNVSRGIDAFGIDFNLANGTGFSGPNEVGFQVDGRAFNIAGSLKDFSLQSVFETARTNSYVEVLSAPTIVTTHNQLAVINVGESRPVITATQTDTAQVTATRSTVQFRDIGIRLSVKPLIGSDGVIQMEIEQTVESVVGNVLIDGNEQPIIGKREATSFVSVSDREVVILGGLQESSQSETIGRVAIFGSIPILGELFRSKRKEERVRELLIFIQPVILPGTDDARRHTRQVIDRSNTGEVVDRFLNEGIPIDARERRDAGPTVDLWRLLTDPIKRPRDP